MKLKIIFPIAILVVLILSFLITIFILNLRIKKVISEVSKLNPDETTLNVIKSQMCYNLVKEKDYWAVNRCKNDVYFKLFLQDNSYYLGYCSSWQTSREAFLKLKKFFGLDCLDLEGDDIEITSEAIQKIGLKEYDLCGGRQVLFKDECILSVR